MLFKSSHGNIYYKIVGSGLPVVILHGYQLSHHVMSHSLEPVFKKVGGFRRIYIDLPGMGRSAHVQGLQSSNDIYRLTAQFTTRLLPKKSFALMGYSYGGYLAQHLAARIPERILGLALIAPVVIANPHRRSVEKQLPLMAGYTPRRFKSFDEKEVFSELAVRNKEVWQKVKRSVLPGMAKANKLVLGKIFSEAYALSHHALTWDKKLKAPTLVLTGKKDTVVGYKDVKKIRKNFTKAKHITIDNAGHNLMFEQPVHFSQSVEHWLKQL